VALSECDAHDAGLMFDVLCQCFSSDRRVGEEPHEANHVRPTVWSGTFDLLDDPEHPTGHPHEPHPVPLSGPVAVDVQGSPLAVRRLREALEEWFRVEEAGSIPGDQEVQVQLRLEGPRSPGAG
jgi:hypothetical protein